MENNSELLIHIDWDGPFTQHGTAQLTKPDDFGIYQVYGAHPVYGTDVLLYIGLAEEQTFGVRLAQHGWCHLNPDSNKVSFYVGRLFGIPHPENDSEWCRQIKLAERLLIHAHKPAQNTQKELASLDRDLWCVHVINWRCYRSLMPEVSGAKWTSRFDELGYETRYSSEKFQVTTDNNIPTKINAADRLTAAADLGC
jgi:hypothetical protein